VSSSFRMGVRTRKILISCRLGPLSEKAAPFGLESAAVQSARQRPDVIPPYSQKHLWRVNSAIHESKVIKSLEQKPISVITYTESQRLQPVFHN
jgi:hypothetical protein